MSTLDPCPPSTLFSSFQAARMGAVPCLPTRNPRLSAVARRPNLLPGGGVGRSQ